MISSLGRNRELGKNNSLIWHIPKDMKFFKDTTMGHTIVMGKNTYLSLPGDLPGRNIIVLTDTKINGNVITMHSIDEVLKKYEDISEEIFICGGASIYRQFIDYASVLYLTEIDDIDKDADTFFPEFDKKDWDREIIDNDEYKGIKYTICKYKKKKK